MRNKNKCLALLLAGSLCNMNTVTAFAANNSSDGNLISSESEIMAETPLTETSETETPEIEISEVEVTTAEANDGWVWSDLNWYYYVNGKRIQNCTYFIDGKWWLFHHDGRLAYDVELTVTKGNSGGYQYRFRSSSDGSLILGWYFNGTHWLYYDAEDGHRYKSKIVEENGRSYYINPAGELMTSAWYIDNEGKSYWADNSGALTEQRTSGWIYAHEKDDDGVNNNADWYYYKDGSLIKDQLYVIDGITYHFDADGRMSTGAFAYCDENGKSGYKLADKSGQVLINGQGWQLMGNDYYYFKETGWLAIDEFLTISGKEYYFNEDTAIMETGVFWVRMYDTETGNTTFCPYIADNSGAIYPEYKTGGWVQYENKWYYFKSPYDLAYNEFVDINGKTYYFVDGPMQQGFFSTNRYDLYFADSSGEVIKNQWFIYNGNWYYAHKNGSVENQGLCEIDGKKYYFRGNMMQTGFIPVIPEGAAPGVFSDAYLSDDSGAIITTEGWTQYNSSWYYINSEGKVALSQWIADHYYVDDRGVMVTGAQIINDICYYFNKSGYLVTGISGWITVDDDWYYLNTDGTMATGWIFGAQIINDICYYFNKSGYLVTGISGWITVDDDWYYLNTDGTMATGWILIGDEWYYMYSDGSMASNQWIGDYYVDASGKMA